MVGLTSNELYAIRTNVDSGCAKCFKRDEFDGVVDIDEDGVEVRVRDAAYDLYDSTTIKYYWGEIEELVKKYNL